MNDITLTHQLITQQHKKNSIFYTFKAHPEIERSLMAISNKIDPLILRLKELFKFPPKGIQILFLTKINNQYQELKTQWNMYIDKIFLILFRIAGGNLILEDNAKKFYNEMHL